MLDNQTPEFFQDVNKPKYNGTLNLDRWAPPFSSPAFSLHSPCTGVQRPNSASDNNDDNNGACVRLNMAIPL